MKQWTKNVIRKQKQQRRQRFSVDTLAQAGELTITDPLEWSNLIAERVGYARYQANKEDTELTTQQTHSLMAAVIREAQEEILNAPDVLAFYLSRHEADQTRQVFEDYNKQTEQYVPRPVEAETEE